MFSSKSATDDINLIIVLEMGVKYHNIIFLFLFNQKLYKHIC